MTPEQRRQNRDDRDDPVLAAPGVLVLVGPLVFVVAVAVATGGRADDRRLLGVTHHGRRLDPLPGQGPEQVVAHVGGRLVPVGGVLAHRLQQDGVELGGDVGVDRRRQPRVLADVLVGNGDRGVAGERRGAGDELVEHAAHGVDVGTGVHPLAACLLG
jgi:hypothetical protein